MKKLILVRHAKSSWDYDVTDHERPLNRKGESDAENLSMYLKNKNLSIDLVLSSDAIRAKTTASIFIKNLSISMNLFKVHHNLYDFLGEDLTRIIQGCENSINTLMVFGHNHAITSFVNTYGDRYIDNVPTCGVTTLQFDIDFWINLNQGKTISTLFPRDLKS